MAPRARAVHRLTPQDQRIARIGAALAAVGFVALWAPSFPDGPALGAAGVGVATAALLLFAARRGSVVLTSVAALLVGFGPWRYAWLFGAPYIAWAGLLLYRASKQAAAAPAEPPEPAPRRAEPVQRRPPRESKRYTPPATRKQRRR